MWPPLNHYAGKAKMARRKKTNSKRSKKINVNLVDTATAVLIGGSIIDSADFVGTGFNATPEFKAGFYGLALKDVIKNLQIRRVQTRVASLAIGSILAKGLAKSLKVRKIAGLGPININV